MLSQRLRHRVDIQALSIAQQHTAGERVETWASILTSDEPDGVPADVVPLSGREFVAAQSVQAAVNTRITLRYRTDVQPAMRVVHEGRYYNIRAVLPDPSLRRHLTLMCEEGPSRG